MGRTSVFFKQFNEAVFKGSPADFMKSYDRLRSLINEVELWVIETPTVMFIYKDKEVFNQVLAGLKEPEPKKTGAKQLEGKLLRVLLLIEKDLISIRKYIGNGFGKIGDDVFIEKMDHIINESNDLKRDITDLKNWEPYQRFCWTLRKSIKQLTEVTENENYSQEIVEKARKLLVVSKVTEA